LRALAARDRAAGQGPADWSDAERERWLTGREGFRAVSAYYDPARYPERIQAPMEWKHEIVAIVASVALAAALDGRSLWTVVVLQPTWDALDDLSVELRRRSARRLGVTAEDVPPPSTHGGWLFVAVMLGPWAWRKLQRKPPLRTSWQQILAFRIISAIDERRSWTEATRRLP
jgi:hypothetical protein